jgi:hypothetical protein
MTDASVQTQDHAGRGRRIAYWIVLVLTTILATLAIFGVWANRQLLNSDNWTETSTKLLENPAIRAQTATFMTEQIYANVDVQGEIKGFLPPVLQPLAAPAAGAARGLVQDVANKALLQPAVQNAWATANREASQRLVNVIEDKGEFTTTTGNAVYLDITPIVTAVAARTGLPADIQAKIPANAGQIKILESDQLSTAQSVAKALKTGDWFLRVLLVLGFGLAIWLARGRRSQALVACGVGLVVAGLAALTIRSVAGGSVVNSLAATEAVRPAATAAWNIGTEMIKTLAWSTIFVGIPAIIVGLLLGPSRWARDARTWMAPVSNTRPEILYGAAVAIVLLLIIWEPVPATRKLITILVFLAVIVGGAYALRRLTLEESPDAGFAVAGAPGAGGVSVPDEADTVVQPPKGDEADTVVSPPKDPGS